MGGYFFLTLFSLAKISSTCIKITSKLVPPPYSIAKLRLPPLFEGEKLQLPPSPHFHFVAPSLPITSNQFLRYVLVYEV